MILKSLNINLHYKFSKITQKIGRTHQYTSVIFQGRKSNNRPPLGQAQNLFKLTKHQ